METIDALFVGFQLRLAASYEALPYQPCSHDDKARHKPNNDTPYPYDIRNIILAAQKTKRQLHK